MKRKKTVRRHAPWVPDPIDYDYKNCNACGKPMVIEDVRATLYGGRCHFAHLGCKEALLDKLNNRPQQIELNLEV
jgi:hypothetical protein